MNINQRYHQCGSGVINQRKQNHEIIIDMCLCSVYVVFVKFAFIIRSRFKGDEEVRLLLFWSHIA